VSPIRVDVHAIESIAEEWDRLADEVGAPPFARPGWTAAGWRSFGRGSLRVLTVGATEGLTGILPVARLGPIVRSPTNWESPSLGFLAGEEASARRLAAALFSTGARRLDLSPIGSDEPGLRSLEEEAKVRRFRIVTGGPRLSPYVSTRGDWETYQAGVSAKLRSEMRRRRRRLEELGEVRLEVTAGGEHLESLLAEGFRVESSGWKGAQGTAIDSNPRTRRFYREVARWADHRGWLRLAFLRLDERPIAFDLSLEADRVHFLLKTGFDHSFHQFGPGVILRSMMLERAFSSPIDTYEFLGTVVGENNRWKLDWTGEYRSLIRFQAFAPSIAGTVDWARFRYGVPAAHRARVSVGRALGPSGRHIVKRGRQLLRQLVT
jgi:CelD/BcsL family acetyltransferase involved in cellulose biosynthesis